MQRSPRDRAVRQVLWIVLGLNLAVAAAKLTFGAMSGALSLLADGVHALLDASSNVVALVGMAVASRPPDAGHPYGHRRYETLTAATIGVLISASTFEIARTAILGAIQGRGAPDVRWHTAAVVATTIVANLVISRYEAKRGRELRSAVLSADAGHTMSDALGALAVLASFGAMALGAPPWVDLAAAAVVVLLVGRTAFGILKTSFGVLTDRARFDPFAVRDVAMKIPGVYGAHKIRSRGSLDAVHLDLHVHVDPAATITAAHAITHDVKDALRAAFPDLADVVIHTEPADGRELDVTTVKLPEDPEADHEEPAVVAPPPPSPHSSGTSS